MGDVQPGPNDLLRAALEKIVFFEWRVSELAAELSAAQSRCATALLERQRAEDEARAADGRARSARMQLAEVETEQARLSSLMTQPGRADASALRDERERGQRLQAQLEDARRELARSRQERERWLTEMTEQARGGDEAPAALAQFISELRGEVIALRARQSKCDELLAKAGIALPEPTAHSVPPPAPQKPSPVDEARVMQSEGRLATPALTTHFALPPDPGLSVAARALAEQCLRNLASADSSRREQAARHLAAMPLPSTAPALAAALGSEREPKARAELAKALGACGGEGAAEIVAQLQNPEEEAPLVRLAALEALAAMPSRAHAAIEKAAADPAPAVRRRAAALADPEAVEPAPAPAPAPAGEQRSPAPSEQVNSVHRAAPPAEGPAAQALQAVQAALFGLTESELAAHIGVPEPEAAALAQKLVAAGQLGRRGKRLVVGAAGGAQ